MTNAALDRRRTARVRATGRAWLAFLLLLLGAGSSTALPVPPAAARRVAQHAILQHIALFGSWGGSTAPAILGVTPVDVDGDRLAFNVTVAPSGHVLVAADDELSAVLLYSDVASLDPSKAASAGSFESWVVPEIAAHFARLKELARGRAAGARPPGWEATGTGRSWGHFGVPDGQFQPKLRRKPGESGAAYGAPGETADSGGPLLTTNWVQGTPYNTYTPADTGCSHTLAGCVAIATAQVMRYWNSPAVGTGSHTYTWYDASDVGHALSANFNHTYSWTLMPASLTTGSPADQIDALARLVSDLAIANEMDFGCAGSSASTSRSASTVLPTYFGYRTPTEVDRSSYSAAQFFATIQAEIDAIPARPILMSVRTTDGETGHSLVVDGYQTASGQMAHLNLGWGSSYQGYYNINGDWTAGGYTWSANSQTIYTGLQPKGVEITAITMPASGATIGQEVALSVTARNNSSTARTVGGISVSFADLTQAPTTPACQSGGPYMGTDALVTAGTTDFDRVMFFKQGCPIHLNGATDTWPANELLVEADTGTSQWAAGASRTMTLKVKPWLVPASGYLRVNIRAWICEQGDCSLTPPSRDPTSGGVDQQGWSVYQRQITVSAPIDSVTITAGPSGSPNPVGSGQTASLTVTASDTLSHTLSYSWTASCPTLAGNGAFNSTTSRTPTWTAPTNATGSTQNCTIGVTASDGYGHSASGSYTQQVSGGVLPNDECAVGPAVTTLPFNSTSDTSAATTEGTDPAPYRGTGARSVWVKVTAPHGGTLWVDTFGSSYDTVVTLYTGACGGWTAVPGGGNDDARGSVQSELRVRVTAGTTYGLMVSAYGSTGGTLHLRMQMPADGDYEGDGKADVTVYRPGSGEWWGLGSSRAYGWQSGYLHALWGAPQQVPVPGDYDGDGKMDLGVYTPATGEWSVLLSGGGYDWQNGYLHASWGAAGDIPVPADYDGDGWTDIAVYRPSTGEWWGLLSTASYDWQNGYLHATWGAPGDVPVPGDYDGDGQADLVVYRPTSGDWWGLWSSTGYDWHTGYLHVVWGAAGQTPVPGDYDGDGKTDVAVYQISTGDWWLLQSTNNYNWQAGYTHVRWGGAGQTPVPQDYDGDGKTDVAVYAAATGDWWLLQSTNNYNWQAGYRHVTWGGVAGDIPIGKSRQ
jgi:hypothetical protein